MRALRQWPVVVGLVLSCLGAPVPADELSALVDTPALPSVIASVQPMSGVAHAGSRVVAVGRRGIVVYSDDAGAHWQQGNVPVSSDLASVAFVNADSGWAVGHEGVILATTDGGRNWIRQLDGVTLGQQLHAYSDSLRAQHADAKLLEEIDRLAAAGIEQSFLDVAFLDTKEGYAVGAFNLLYHTGDGGAHWQPELAKTDNARFLHLYSIRRIGADIYIAGEQGLVLKFDRASGRFVSCPTPYQGSFFGVIGDARAVLVFGLRGNAWRSIDGGASWRPVEAGSPAAAAADEAQEGLNRMARSRRPPVGVTGGAVLDDGRWVLVDMAGVVRVSKDSGETFAAAAIPPDAPYSAVADAGRNRIALTGWRGALTQPLPQ